MVGAKSRSTRRRSRAPGWKRRGRLRARMAARVHLTPIFPARGSVALSPSSSSPSASSAAAGPRSRLCHFFALVASLSLSLLDPRGSKVPSPGPRERMVHGASGSPHPFTLRARPFQRFRVNYPRTLPSPSPVHPYLTAILLLSSLLQLVLPSFLSSYPYFSSPLLFEALSLLSFSTGIDRDPIPHPWVPFHNLRQSCDHRENRIRLFSNKKIYLFFNKGVSFSLINCSTKNIKYKT